MTGAPLEYRSASTPLAHSRAGIASLVLGVLCLGGLCLSAITNRRGGTGTSPSAVVLVIGLACLSSPVLGVALGIVGLCSKERKRITATIGVCLNALVLLLLTVAMALILAME